MNRDFRWPQTRLDELRDFFQHELAFARIAPAGTLRFELLGQVPAGPYR